MAITKKNWFDNEFATVLHEVMHLVGMSSGIWEYFYDRDGSDYVPVDDVLMDDGAAPFPNRVKSPRVLEWAKDHYSCSTMDGVPLENVGGDGTAAAHWDKSVVGNDMMNPSDYFNVVNSGLNYALVDDMGHYTSNYDMEEYLVWGHNSGCGIFSGNCNQNPMTCTEDTNLCSPEYLSMGVCRSDELSEDCPTFHEVSYGDCRIEDNKLDLIADGIAQMYFGAGSRCIEGTIDAEQSSRQGNCLKTTCDGTSSVTIEVLGEEITCSSSETGNQKTVTGSFSIYCPDVAKLCLAEISCPEDCNANGRCLKDGSCWCYQGFSGDSCSEEVPVAFQMVIAVGGIFIQAVSICSVLSIFAWLNLY
jgi:leishmanolysin